MADKEEVGSVVVEVTADTSDFDKQMAGLAASVGMQAQQINRLFGATATASAAAAASTKAVNQALQQLPAAATAGGKALQNVQATSRDFQKQAGFLSSNIFAQLQDVAVQIQSGTGILQIALQQGTQTALVLNNAAQAGATLGQSLGLIGRGLLSFLSPATLIPVALIGATAAAAKFFQSIQGNSRTAAEQLKALQEIMKGVGESFGIATEHLDDFAKASRQAQQVAVLAGIQKSATELEQTVRDVREELASPFTFGFAGIRGFGELAEQAQQLSYQLQAGNYNTDALQAKIKELARIPAFAEKAQELLGLIERIRIAQGQQTAYNKLLDILDSKGTYGKINDQAKAYTETLKEIEKLRPVDDKLIDQFEKLEKAIQRSATSSEQLAAGLGLIQDIKNKIADQEQEVFDLDNLDNAQDKIFETIKRFEQFRSRPYNDPSKAQARRGEQDFAIGFGMHQRWDDDAKKYVDILQGMTISQEQATKELARQWRDIYFPAVERAIGKDTWDHLSDNAKAALGSIAYNYGHIPKAVADAARSLNSDALAASIRGLKVGDVNDRRREEEALLVLGQTMAGVTQAQNDYNVSAEHAIALEKLKNSLILDGVYEQTKQVAILRERFKLEEDHIPITAEANRLIEEKAELEARAAEAQAKAGENHKLALKQQKEENAQLQQLKKAWDGLSDTLEDAFVDAILNGEKFEDVIKNLTKSLLEMALRAQLSNLFGLLGQGIFPGAAGAGKRQFGGFFGTTSVAAATTYAPVAGSTIAARSAGAGAAPVVQLHVVPGEMFEPRVAAISGQVSVRTVAAATPSISRAAASYMSERQRAY